MSLKNKLPKRLIGYARVSTQQQDLARQLKALKRVGCVHIFSDTASGKSMAGRPQLASALEELDTGDELVIAEWDRATRSMWDGLQIIKAVIDAEAAIKVLDRSYIDLTTPMGRGIHGDDVRYGGGRTPTHHQADARGAADRAGEWRQDGAQAETHALPDQGSAPAHRQGRANTRRCQGL